MLPLWIHACLFSHPNVILSQLLDTGIKCRKDVWFYIRAQNVHWFYGQVPISVSSSTSPVTLICNMKDTTSISLLLSFFPWVPFLFLILFCSFEGFQLHVTGWRRLRRIRRKESHEIVQVSPLTPFTRPTRSLSTCTHINIPVVHASMANKGGHPVRYMCNNVYIWIVFYLRPF